MGGRVDSIDSEPFPTTTTGSSLPPDTYFESDNDGDLAREVALLAVTPAATERDPATDTLFTDKWFELAGEDEAEWRAVAEERRAAAATATPAPLGRATPAPATPAPAPRFSASGAPPVSTLVPAIGAASMPPAARAAREAATYRAAARRYASPLPAWAVPLFVVAAVGGLGAWFVATATAVGVVIAFG